MNISGGINGNFGNDTLSGYKFPRAREIKTHEHLLRERIRVETYLFLASPLLENR